MLFAYLLASLLLRLVCKMHRRPGISWDERSESVQSVQSVRVDCLRSWQVRRKT